MVKSTSEISDSLLEPIREKLTSLSETVNNLATKNDIQSFFKIFEDKFSQELSLRDKKNYELEDKLLAISEQRVDDLEYT